MPRVISTGAQDYEQLISNKCFYVDKTLFIKEWWESQDIVTLITRPRRFGKTLNMSMLECFWSLKYQGRSELFEGLNIWREEKYRNLQETVQAALDQIEEKKYEQTLLDHGVKQENIRKYGFAFEGKKVLIGSM